VPFYNEIGNPHVIASGGRETMPTELPGTMAGWIRWSQPVSGGPNKQIILNFQGYKNSTRTAQTISLVPYTFAYMPSAYGQCPSNSLVATATAISLPKAMRAAFTGDCFVAGEITFRDNRNNRSSANVRFVDIIGEELWGRDPCKYMVYPIFRRIA
jgi:hypothetical protein